MRFLADESCDFNVVRALRAAGFDVLAVAEVIPRATDDRVIERTAAEDRILLTEDKDFGQLVYASAEPSPGVVLIPFPMCLAVVVASPLLLESRARTIEQMRLINALCRFVEVASV